MSHLPATQMKVPRSPLVKNNTLQPKMCYFKDPKTLGNTGPMILCGICRQHVWFTCSNPWGILFEWFGISNSSGKIVEGKTPCTRWFGGSGNLAGKKPAKSQPGDVSEIFPKESHASGIPKLCGKWNTKPFAGSFWYILTNSWWVFHDEFFVIEGADAISGFFASFLKQCEGGHRNPRRTGKNQKYSWGKKSRQPVEVGSLSRYIPGGSLDFFHQQVWSSMEKVLFSWQIYSNQIAKGMPKMVAIGCRVECRGSLGSWRSGALVLPRR